MKAAVPRRRQQKGAHGGRIDVRGAANLDVAGALAGAFQLVLGIGQVDAVGELQVTYARWGEIAITRSRMEPPGFR
jgi:hypothetical protein